MRHRERLLAALQHREPDRVPLDLGAALACSINVQTYDGLKKRLGLATPTLALHRLGQVAVVEEAVLQRFDVDARGIRPGGIGAGTPAAWHEAWQGERDEWGVVWNKPANGHAYDVDSPFRAEVVSAADLARHRWPDPDDPARLVGLRERALCLRDESDYGVVLSLSLYPYDQCHMLRGYTNWLMDLAADPRFAAALLDAVTEAMVAMVDHVLAEVGDLVDVVCWGDDISNQNGPMIAPHTYRQIVRPRHERMMAAFKRGTAAKVFFHTDGSVAWAIDDLIDIGVDILNPVQVAAAGMDTAILKRRFGDRVSFWGAGCDSQGVLPFGTPEQVREEVRRRLSDLAPGGGFVFAPIHHIEAEVPPDNVVAMYDAAREFGVYSH
ncbi:MAG: uroporphyrinogen decarboxylase family protein [Chloroflexi bacterium]|nr:uroporphyrinogen decarboxylase family protein [Chloroflexota bacterium]MCL5110332.1 uroporphyrinogen decarboxylase family protein [Chloroflexota bacterium]MDA8219422.1 hypothetical protein [Dehalococcoidales bacterium]